MNQNLTRILKVRILFVTLQAVAVYKNKMKMLHEVRRRNRHTETNTITITTTDQITLGASTDV